MGVGDLAGTELVLATHQHLDHLDTPALASLLERDDRVRVVVPAPVVADAAEAGLPRDRLVGARPGEPVAAGDVTVHPVPSLHGVHVTDAYAHGLPGDGNEVRYLGYVLETPDGRVYHSGDTLRWPGQAELLPAATGSRSRCCPSTAATPSGRPTTSSATWTPARPWPWPATPGSGRSCRCTTT